MAKTPPLGVRLEPAEQLALKQEAADEKRPVSTMARLLICEALEARRNARSSAGKRKERPR